MECPHLSQEIGRCGAKNGGRCNKDLDENALYCNLATGWCTDTTSHRNGHLDDIYDWLPSSCKHCILHDRYLSGYATGSFSSSSFSSLQDAKAECLRVGNCNGVTQEKRSHRQYWTLRAGIVPKISSKSPPEISILRSCFGRAEYALTTVEGGCCATQGSLTERCHCLSTDASRCKYLCDEDEKCNGYAEKQNGDCQLATTSGCPSECNKYDIGNGNIIANDASCGDGYTGCKIKKCIDISSTCITHIHLCSSRDDIRKHCKRSCGICNDGTTEPTATNTHGIRTTPVSGNGKTTDAPADSNPSPVPVECPNGRWRCSNNDCINLGFRCDGENDCKDWSDERDCPEYQKLLKTHCAGEAYGSYSSLLKAKSACDVDSNCSAVYDSGCDNIHGFRLCPSSFSSRASSSCLHKKLACTMASDCTDGKVCGNGKCVALGDSYTSFIGDCSANNNTDSHAEEKKYKDRDCKDRCDQSTDCTAYSISSQGENLCKIYTLIGMFGNGNTTHKCYVKITGCFRDQDCAENQFCDQSNSTGWFCKKKMFFLSEIGGLCSDLNATRKCNIVNDFDACKSLVPELQASISANIRFAARSSTTADSPQGCNLEGSNVFFNSQAYGDVYNRRDNVQQICRATKDIMKKFIKRENKACTPKTNAFTNLNIATEACWSDVNCKFVYDILCDGKKSAICSSSAETFTPCFGSCARHSCLYEKDPFFTKTIFHHGCWKDDYSMSRVYPRNSTHSYIHPYLPIARAIPWVKDCQDEPNPIQCCIEAAKANGYRFFALQSEGACMTSKDAGEKYQIYGPSFDCPATGHGGTHLNDVYQILDVSEAVTTPDHKPFREYSSNLSVKQWSQPMPYGHITKKSSYCTSWLSFQASLAGKQSKSITVGSGSTYYRCENTTVTKQITDELAKCLSKDDIDEETCGVKLFRCNNRVWSVGHISGGSGAELMLDGDVKSCTGTLAIRPCAGNENWGGLGVFCDSRSQTLSIDVVYQEDKLLSTNNKELVRARRNSACCQKNRFLASKNGLHVTGNSYSLVGLKTWMDGNPIYPEDDKCVREYNQYVSNLDLQGYINKAISENWGLCYDGWLHVCETSSIAQNKGNPTIGEDGIDTCTDGILNGDETDIDCGGNNCPFCSEYRCVRNCPNVQPGCCSSSSVFRPERCTCANSDIASCKRFCNKDSECTGYWNSGNGKCSFATYSDCPNGCIKEGKQEAGIYGVRHVNGYTDCDSSSCYIKQKERCINSTNCGFRGFCNFKPQSWLGNNAGIYNYDNWDRISGVNHGECDSCQTARKRCGVFRSKRGADEYQKICEESKEVSSSENSVSVTTATATSATSPSAVSTTTSLIINTSTETTIVGDVDARYIECGISSNRPYCPTGKVCKHGSCKEYYLTEKSQFCPDGLQVIDLTSCNEAVQMIKNEIPNAYFYAARSYNAPKGCYLDTHGSGNKIFFNLDMDNSRYKMPDNARQICITAKDKGYQLTEKGELCSDVLKGTVAMDECKNAAKTLGYIYSSEVNLYWLPKGCYLYRNRVKWNRDETNQRSAEIQAICRKDGCKDSNGIKGYEFSHMGTFSSHRKHKGVRNKASDCAEECNKAKHCVAFTYQYHDTRDCFIYFSLDAHLYEDAKSKAYFKCNECVTKSSDCPIGKLCNNGICRVEKVVYSASPVDGPVIEDVIPTLPNVSYLLRLDIQRADTQYQHQYANIEVDGKWYGKCNPDVGSYEFGSCSWHMCSKLSFNDLTANKRNTLIRIVFSSSVNAKEYSCHEQYPRVSAKISLLEKGN